MNLVTAYSPSVHACWGQTHACRLQGKPHRRSCKGSRALRATCLSSPLGIQAMAVRLSYASLTDYPKQEPCLEPCFQCKHGCCVCLWSTDKTPHSRSQLSPLPREGGDGPALALRAGSPLGSSGLISIPPFLLTAGPCMLAASLGSLAAPLGAPQPPARLQTHVGVSCGGSAHLPRLLQAVSAVWMAQQQALPQPAGSGSSVVCLAAPFMQVLPDCFCSCNVSDLPCHMRWLLACRCMALPLQQWQRVGASQFSDMCSTLLSSCLSGQHCSDLEASAAGRRPATMTVQQVCNRSWS